MKALMISSDPYSKGAEYSLKAYREGGLEVDLVRSVMEGIEMAKANKYALVIVEKTAKEQNSIEELGMILEIIRNKNPHARGFAHGWLSAGFHYNVNENYTSNRHNLWVNYIRKAYLELSLSSENLS